MANNQTEEIKEKINLVEYIGQFVTLQNRSGRFMGCCPFHKEKTPSFSVDPDRAYYYCFGCHKGGDIFNFMMEYEKLSFPEALEKAAAKAGVALEKNGDGGSGRNRELKLKKEALIELNNRLSHTFAYFLLETDQGVQALEYILSRGINRDTISFFQLGYAPADPRWLYGFLQKKNYSPPFLEESGLFSRRRRGYPLFRDRLVFPIFSLGGDSVAYSARLLNGEGPKYINSPETVLFKKGKLLFGLGKTLPHIREEKSFVLCEGNVDVLALYQAGCRNCVAPLGTALTEDQLKLLKRYADRGVILFDGDKAGFEATKKAAILCENLEIGLKAGILPEGQDPSDILQREGGEYLKKIVYESIIIFDFLLECSIRIVDVYTPEGKSTVVKELTPYLRAVKSEVKRQAYLESMADKLGLDRRIVILEYQNGSAPAVTLRQNSQVEPEKMSDELYLVLIALANPSCVSELKKELHSGELRDSRAVKLWELMEKWEDIPQEPNDILSRLNDNEPLLFYKEWIKKDEMKLNVQFTLERGLRVIKLRNLERRSREITALLNKSGKDDDRIEAELLNEKMRIDREIQRIKVL
ncbi:MAG: DNA primase [Spirochaetales bacterium]|nr:DNA primase [Spirochaetales bacterium]